MSLLQTLSNYLDNWNLTGKHMVITGFTEWSLLPRSAWPGAFTMSWQVWRRRILLYIRYLTEETSPSCFNKLVRFTRIPVLRCLQKSFGDYTGKILKENLSIYFKQLIEETFPKTWKLTREKEKAKSCIKNRIQEIPEKQSPSRAKIDTEEQGKHMSNRHINIKCRKPREE